MPLHADETQKLSGFPRVVDGDTLAFDKDRVRILGIDAFERAQLCLSRTGVEYKCGDVATQEMNDIIARRPVTCISEKRDVFGRALAQCYVGEDRTDIGRELTRKGWAVAYRRYSKLYVDDEEQAKASQRGAWAGSFEYPWVYRQAKRQAQ